MALQRPANQLSDLRDELVCPVCLDFYNIPVILPCSHVLCRSCSERLFEHSFIRCPVCRERNYISGGLEALPRVLTLENILDRYRSEEPEEGVAAESEPMDVDAIPCQLCKGHSRKAVKSCRDCNASYCAKCLDMSHPDRVPFSEHTLTEPTENPRPKVTNCSVHDERASVYCLTCHVIGCLLCIELKCHQGHQILAVNEAYTMEKDVLSESLRNLEANEQSLLGAIRQLDQNHDDLTVHLDNGRLRINNECDSLIREIDSRRNYFLADLEYEVKEKMTLVEDAANEFRRQSSKAQSLSRYGREILRELDKAAFLQLSHSVNERVEKGTKDSVLPEEELVHVLACKLKPKVVDFRKERALLRELSFLVVLLRRVLLTNSFEFFAILYFSADSTGVGLQVFENVEQCSPHTCTTAVKYRKATNETRTVGVVFTASNVVDMYVVTRASLEDDVVRTEDTAIFKVPEEERKSFATDRDTQTMLVISYLQLGTQYKFTVKAVNGAGESPVSTPVYCTTLSSPETEFPVPEMDPTLSRAFTSSIQIYCLTPSQFANSDQYTFHLLYREANVTVAPRVWRAKPMSSHGILDHRIFGLASNTQYEFMVLLIGAHNICQMSDSLVLKTGSAAF